MSFVFHPHVIAVHGLKYQGCLILTLHTYMKILSIFGVLSGPVTGGGVCACSCHSMSVTTTFPVEVVWRLLPWCCVEMSEECEHNVFCK